MPRSITHFKGRGRRLDADDFAGSQIATQYDAIDRLSVIASWRTNAKIDCRMGNQRAGGIG
jgi:hypothetical protein